MDSHPHDRVVVLEGLGYVGYPLSVKKSPITPRSNARCTWLELWGKTDFLKN